MKWHYGWVIVLVGALMTCIGIGSMFSLAVFMQPIATETGWSRSGISMAATLDFLFMGAASFFWGALSDKFGTRVVVLSGSALLGAGLVTASRATTLIEFQLLFGVLIGVAIGSYYAPMMAAATDFSVAASSSGEQPLVSSDNRGRSDSARRAGIDTIAAPSRKRLKIPSQSASSRP